LAVAVAALSATGCASYASARLAPDETLGKPPEVFGEIEKFEFEKTVQVRLPAQLVVADVASRSRGNHDDTSDKRGVQLVEALAQEKGAFADVSPLFLDGGPEQFDRLRRAAARHHADLMVVTSMVEQVKDKTGALAALNILVLPCFIVPTQTNDLVLHLRAAVVDVRNNLVYATFEDHREERVHATVVDEKDSVEQGFDRLYADSLAKMRTRISERLKSLAPAP
jgi:hypothetical protein